jgi:hypothetical protein
MPSGCAAHRTPTLDLRDGKLGTARTGTSGTL